jgi:thiosulfate/3-mercaptopyruvate sulfurtransferase
VTSDVPRFAAVQRSALPWPGHRFVTADELAASVGDAVFDARAAQRYAAGDPDVDPRPGHIPGALSAPWAGNLRDDGRFADPALLGERFAPAAGRRAIAYCGSGVTACHDLLAMELAGLTDTALYPGSWSQWGADPARPAETG